MVKQQKKNYYSVYLMWQKERERENFFFLQNLSSFFFFLSFDNLFGNSDRLHTENVDRLNWIELKWNEYPLHLSSLGVCVCMFVCDIHWQTQQLKQLQHITSFTPMTEFSIFFQNRKKINIGCVCVWISAKKKKEKFFTKEKRII